MKELLIILILLGAAEKARPDSTSTVDRTRGSVTTQDQSQSINIQDSTSYNSTISVEKLIFPLFSQLEISNTRFGNVKLGEFCKFSNSTARVWSHGKGGVGIVLSYGDLGPNRFKFSTSQQIALLPGVGVTFLEPPISMVPFIKSHKSREGVHILGEPWPHYSAMKCYALYSIIAEIVSRDLLSQAQSRSEDPLTRATILHLDDPDTRAQASMSRYFYSDSFNQAHQVWSELERSECLVPSANGIMNGQVVVRCGPYELDPQTKTFKRGGVTLLSPDTVAGIKLSFAQVNATSAAESTSRSDSTHDRRERRQSGTIIQKDRK